MPCSVCGSENRKHAKFCGGCGAPLALECAKCGSKIAWSNKFCDSCGAAVPTEVADVTVEANDVAADQPRAAERFANRRQMSLMSCDLVDSSILANSLDPEDLRYAINNFHQISKQIIEQYEGYYAQYMGDGFMAYFSYPAAHEDDAYRAVLTGLKILDAIGSFNIDLKAKHDVELQLRIGVDTGQVVVDKFVIGQPPNVAARVQAAANPNTLVITETTKRLLPTDAFSYQDLGVQELKNIGALRLFRVIEQKRTDSPAESKVTRPLIGRDKQLGLLSDHWDLAKDGNGQAVILAGEPGIGKSRLVQRFEAELGTEAQTILRFHGSPFHRNTMLYPVIETTQLAAKINTDDPDSEKLAKLRDFLSQFSKPERILPLVSGLLSISGQASTSSGNQAPAPRVLQETLDVLIDIALQYANRGPTLLIFEDIHWFDATSMNLLEQLIPMIRNERVLLLFTTRSTSTPQLQEKYFLTQIVLSRLRLNEVEELIGTISGSKALLRSLHTQIFNKANGVPLYVEELTKMVLDAEGIEDEKSEHPGSESDFVIPLTLRDPLTSRVDRVKGRRVLQLAATLGRKFTFELLQAVSSLDAEALSKEIRHLVAAELLYQKGTVLQEATFEFKHALIRDAAYALLTKAERETYHKRVGQLLEERFSETAKAHPEIVAYHYTQARSYEKALHYWYEAGKLSAARSAHNEAIGHLQQALRQIPYVDDPLVRNKMELLAQTALGNAIRTTKGWSIEGVKHAYTRALQLGKEGGFEEHTFPAVFGLWSWNFVHAVLDEAQTLAEQLRATAEHVDNAVYRVFADEAVGFTAFAQGKFAAANAALERGVSLCDDSQAATYLDLVAQDPRVHVRAYHGTALWFLGHPDRALQVCTEALQHAERSQHPFSKAMARTISLRVHQFRGEAGVVANRAGAAIAVCQEHEFEHYLAMALILRGWASAQQGEFEKGIAELQDGLEKERATGGLLLETYSLGLLADACIKNERYGQAFDFLEQAQVKLEAEGSIRFYAAEIYRLLGEAYLRSRRDLQQAERWLAKGLTVAREQKAKSLELRLAVSLYDLFAARQIAAEYRPRLAEIYASFSEGFDTADLLTAKARLKRV
jgi:class 3 adenylate cyclase/tetratricopeptide (TPR) repeat protein